MVVLTISFCYSFISLYGILSMPPNRRWEIVQGLVRKRYLLTVFIYLQFIYIYIYLQFIYIATGRTGGWTALTSASNVRFKFICLLLDESLEHERHDICCSKKWSKKGLLQRPVIIHNNTSVYFS